MSSSTKPVTVNVSTEPEGTRWFRDGRTTTTPGTEQDLDTYVVPASKVLELKRLVVSCIMSSSYRYLEDSSEIASGLLGAGKPSMPFEWKDGREVTAGKTLTLKLLQPETASTQVEPSVDVSYHIEGALKDA
jgi:hypothetical protein